MFLKRTTNESGEPVEQQLFVECLMQFGLTRQEAVIYQCLLTEGKLTGYEVAKSTGISRSNAYGAIAALVEKGGAYLVEESAKKYVPVPLEEFCDNRIRRLEKDKAWILSHMPDAKVTGVGYITINGEEHILDKMKNLILHADERVYISCTHTYLHLVDTEIRRLVKQHKKVVIITDKAIHYKSVKAYMSEDKGTQIGIIVDSRYVLTGEYGEGSMNTCLYSGQKNFVELFKNALANEIKLIGYTKGEL